MSRILLTQEDSPIRDGRANARLNLKMWTPFVYFSTPRLVNRARSYSRGNVSYKDDSRELQPWHPEVTPSMKTNVFTCYSVLSLYSWGYYVGFCSLLQRLQDKYRNMFKKGKDETITKHKPIPLFYPLFQRVSFRASAPSLVHLRTNFSSPSSTYISRNKYYTTWGNLMRRF